MQTQPAAAPGASASRGRATVRLARLVSLVLHPFVVCPAGIVLVLWLDRGDLWAALRWAALCAGMVVFPALVWLAWAIRRQRYADADVSVRHHRYGFYAFGLGCLLLCHGTLAWSGAPAVLRAGVVAAMLAVASGALANRFWGKVSIHAGALTGIAAVSSLYSLPLALALGILAAVVAWARVAMGRHTVVQTLAGGLLALVCVLTVLWPWR